MMGNSYAALAGSTQEALVPSRAGGRLSGFANLWRKENAAWWGSRRWLVQAVIWLALVNGLVASLVFVVPTMSQLAASASGAEAVDALEGGLAALFQLGMTAIALGAIVLTHDAVIGERQAGITEWILSKPVSRPAYLLAKLLANAIAVLVLLVLLQSAVAYGLIQLGTGALAVLPFLAAVGLLALNTLFYLTLTLMMGTVSDQRALVLGLPLGVVLAGMIVPALLPGPAMSILRVTPWLFPQAATAIAGGVPVPGAAIASQVVATVAWCGVFAVLALWRFQRTEF